MNVCMPRSRDNYLATLALLHVETNKAWIRRDVTGDGVPETFCNQAVEEGCKVMECPLPPGKLANWYADWLIGPDGRAAGWVRCSPDGAQAFARQGFPTLAFLSAPRHGHIVFVVPPTNGGTGLHTWQAGRTNHENKPISASWNPEDLKRVVFATHV